MAQNVRRWPYVSLFLLTSLSFQVECQPSSSPTPDPKLLQEFPLLGSLYSTPVLRSQWLGGQNFTQCCLKAVSESYVDQNGQIVSNPNKDEDFVGLSPDEFSQRQFPCGATYTGDLEGAPVVTVPYAWCAENCGGWQKSKNSALGQWVQPFVGFILPAAVFCLNVPRKAALAVPDGLFKDAFKDVLASLLAFVDSFQKLWGRARKTNNASHPELRSVRTLDFVKDLLKVGFHLIVLVLFTVIRGTLAAGISLVDTIIWIGICFSEAGPMVLSGLYEATLDRKILSSVHHEIETKTKMGLKRQKERKQIKERREAVKKRRREEKKKGRAEPKNSENLDNIAQMIEGDEGGLSEDKNAAKNSEYIYHEEPDETPGLYRRIHMLYAVLVGNLILFPEDLKQRSAWDDVQVLVRTDKDRKTIRTRLSGMLGCQASFGAAVGAPVVFFLGSFLFSVISNLNVVGDNDTSHALAFGMWWMTIPHVAVISGCLLAGNNPNTLEVIICGIIRPWTEGRQPDDEFDNPDLSWRKTFLGWVINLYGPFYDSVYQPVWMWERGRSKRNWIRKVLGDHYVAINTAEKQEIPNIREIQPSLKSMWKRTRNIIWKHDASDSESIEAESSPDVEAQRSLSARKRAEVRKFDHTFWDWVETIAITVALMFIPFVLAFLTSFFTPTVGLSCRTFTFLLYFLFQLYLCLIWCWDFPHLEQSALIAPAAWVPIAKSRPTVYCLFRGFGMLGSLFTAVVGTFLQILGVYRNCLCNLPISAWRSRDFSFVISTNTALDIHYAKHFWLQTGTASIVLLVVVCYVGWWYQRHWRLNFRDLIELLLEDPKHQIERIEDRVMGLEERNTPGEKNVAGTRELPVETSIVDVTDAIRPGSPRGTMET